MSNEIWLLGRTSVHGNVLTWYGYWESEEAAVEYAKSNAEEGDGTPCDSLCNNKADWFEAHSKTPEEIEEIERIRVKGRVDGVPVNASEVGV